MRPDDPAAGPEASPFPPDSLGLPAGAEAFVAAIRLHLYDPTRKQLDFHRAGAGARERLFLAGNQLGKTTAGALELAMHLTGDYPPWWEGRRFLGPIVAWAAGVSGESTRDNPQRLLLGRPGAFGTGAIPRAAIGTPTYARGIAGLVDTVRVRHRRRGASLLSFKTYGKGAQKLSRQTVTSERWIASRCWHRNWAKCSAAPWWPRSRKTSR